MVWIVCGVIVTSFLYPIHLAVSYFHSLYTSSRGHTNQEKYRHYRVSLVAIGKIVLITGLAMCAWGAASTYIPTSWVNGEMNNPGAVSERPEKIPSYPGDIPK
jgi:hypothetical protein